MTTPFNRIVCEYMEKSRPRTNEELRDSVRRAIEAREKKEEPKKKTKKMRYCR